MSGALGGQARDLGRQGKDAGGAEVSGLELEGKGPLKQLLAGADAPDVDLRIGATRNWSHVDGVAGPGARLSQQTPWSASAGVDWHVHARPVTVGASYVYERGGFVRSTSTESLTLPDKRQLDLYLLWKVDKDSQWRATLGNALAPHANTMTRYEDATQRATTGRTDRTTAT